MPCPSCGASFSDTGHCTECEAAGLSSTELDTQNHHSEESATPSHREPSRNQAPRRSTLLEFPGVVRSTVPEWRRELSERVREVQERRAREAAQEAAEAEHARLAEATAVPAPQLELLPQVSAPTINPLVAAALRRIERANQKTPAAATHARAAAAVAYATEDELDSSPDEPILNSAATVEFQQPTIDSPVVQPEKTHNLVVVPSAVTVTKPAPPRKVVTKRLLSDNDPVLNYLDAVPTSSTVKEAPDCRAGIARRMCAAVVDLVIAALLFSPFAAAIELTNGDWHKLRTIAIAATGVLIVSFLYLTAATALTGRTGGMRLMALRTVDKRTGLIPTGAQSAGRAVVYLGSLLALGLPAVYALLNHDGYTAHDQMTHTMVVRD